MIDIENDVFDTVATALRAAHSGVFVTGEYTDVPPSFPAVTIVESDNRVLARMRTVHIENAVSVTYEANIYSNKVNGRKAEAKAIADTLDAPFEASGFTRTMRDQIPNINDATIFRITCRYEAVVAPNGSDNFLVYQNY